MPPPPEDRRGLLIQFWTSLPRLSLLIGSVVGGVSLIWGLTIFLTGGLRPQTQIDIADMKAAISELRTQLHSTQDGETSNRALTQNRIEAAERLFNSRLDAMWRPQDYVDRDAHLARLDQAFGELRDKTTDNTYAIKDLTAKYQSLTTVPTPAGRR